MTERQAEILAFMREYLEENDQLPSLGCIGREYGVSFQAAHGIVLKLERQGHLERNACGKYRFPRRLGAEVVRVARESRVPNSVFALGGHRA